MTSAARSAGMQCPEPALSLRAKAPGGPVKKREEPLESSPLDGDEHLVFKDITTLLVREARAVPQVKNPGSGEMVSYLVLSEVGSRRAELMVRVHPTRGSYACWQIQEGNEQHMSMLGTFGAGLA
jgi:hypothetical protein